MNLSFLNPSVLWALPLALVPLVIHLFFRRNPRRVEFSDLMFIRKALEKVRTGLRLRRYLLLLTRMLILLLLVVFFSRPLRHAPEGAAEEREKPVSVVILADVSYSMGCRERGKPLIEEYRSIARRIVSQLPARNRIGIIAYSNRVEAATPGLSNDRGYLTRMIDSLALSDRPTDLSAAWPSVQQLLDQTPGSRSVVIVLSDCARHGFPRPLPSSLPGGRVFVLEPVSRDNLWIEDARPSFDDAAQAWTIDMNSRSGAPQPPASWPVSCFTGDKRTGSDLLVFSADGKTAGRFTYPGGELAVSGRCELAADALAADNAFYWSGRRTPPYSLWIVDGDPRSGGITAESFYLRTAFPGAETVTESELAGTPLKTPGTVILANVRGDDPAIENFIRSGGGALIFLGDHYSEKYQPPYLPASIGTQFTDLQRISWDADGHPLSADLELSSFESGNLAVEKGFVLQPFGQSRVLAHFASGWPYLVERTYGSGRVILCATTADRDWNNAPSKPIFVPLLRSLARHLSGSSGSEETLHYTVGEALRTRSVPGAQLRSPSGRTLPLTKNGDDILCSDTEERGIYRLLSEGREVRRFAVNLDASSGESDLAAAGSGELQKFFAGAKVEILPRDSWERDFLSLLSGKDISRYLLIFLALLVLCEVFLANQGPRREQ